MEFASNPIADDCDVPNKPFVDILTENCQLIHQHMKVSKDCLMMVANISNSVTTIKLFDKDLEDSPNCYTLLFQTTQI